MAVFHKRLPSDGPVFPLSALRLQGQRNAADGPDQHPRPPSRLKCFRSVKASGRQCHCSLSCRWSPGACLQCVHRYIEPVPIVDRWVSDRRGVAWSPLVTSRRFGGGTRACRWSLSWPDDHRQSGRESVSPANC